MNRGRTRSIALTSALAFSIWAKESLAATRLLSICVAMLLMSFSAHANAITDFSFETPASPSSLSLSVGSIVLTGWTTTLAEIVQIKNGDFAGITAQDGTYSLDLTGNHD